MNRLNITRVIKNFAHLILSYIYAILNGNPSRKLKVIGVTGTDGKTTTSNIIYQILKYSKRKVGVISTLNAKYNDKEYPLGFHVTTPEAKVLQKFLRNMVKEDIEFVVLETTSHGLDQYRLAGIKYISATYTNVTEEHLDYHLNYENYLNTKSRLIGQTAKNGFVILNKDDKSYDSLYKTALKLHKKVVTYSTIAPSEYQASDILLYELHSEYTLIVKDKINKTKEYKVIVNLPGKYNIYNSLAAVATSVEHGVPIEVAIESLKDLPSLEGRWEVIQNTPYKIIVDFAHTPNALRSVLEKASSNKECGNLISVFGCAGLRDRYKRPIMGEYAGELADIVILTAEDPRTEKVDDIIEQIEVGVQKNRKMIKDKTYFKINDRRKALKKALSIAKANDIVLVTGKGHEKSMNLDGKTEIPWSDKDVILSILTEL